MPDLLWEEVQYLLCAEGTTVEDWAPRGRRVLLMAHPDDPAATPNAGDVTVDRRPSGSHAE